MTEVGVGTAIVAYIEPHAGQAQAFNRWYERDHFYAATTGGPGAFSGARWVATRACKAVRPPAATWFGDPARGSYLTTVWLLEDAQDEWEAWVTRQMETAPGSTRTACSPAATTSRRACTGSFGEARAGAGVSAATALDHPHAGVVLLAVSPGARRR